MSGAIQSLPCPKCGKRILLPLTSEETEALLTPGVPIQRALADYNPDIRERFVSGYCPTHSPFRIDGASPSDTASKESK